MKSMKVCLFGGALLSAGLASGVARAQSFSFQDSYAVSYAVEFATGSLDVDVWDAAGEFEISSSSYANNNGVIGNGYGRVLANSGEIEGYSFASYGLGQGYALSYFQVDQNVSVDLAWDFSGGSGVLYLYDVTGGFALLGQDGGQNSGLQTVPLTAGNQYAAKGFATSHDGASRWSVSIVPSPGASGVLGVAGVMAMRRRRAGWRGR